MLQQSENRMMNNGAAKHYNGGVGIPIPKNVGGKSVSSYHTSSGFFSSDDSPDGSPTEDSPPSSENNHSLSSSYHSGLMSGNLPLNIYGTSPRTSVMFNYYASPKGSYSRPHPHLIRTRSTDSSSVNSTHPTTPHSRSENISFRDSNDNINAEVEKPKKTCEAKAKLSHHFQHLDLRPRAWSESDKNRNNCSLQNSRKSALQKLKMKLGQKGNMKRQKSQDEDEKNKSTASIQALEKVEEGRQLDCATPLRPRSQVLSPEQVRNAAMGTMHQEYETRKKAERRVGVVLSPPKGLPQVQENPNDHLVYQRFLEEHTCYDIMPTSSKLVVLDTRLEVRKAFHALIENSLRCAPLWDSELQDYVGLLTVSDFVSILLAYDKCPNKKLEDLENQKITCWRNVLSSRKTLVQCTPQDSLFDAIQRLTDENIRRLAIVHPDNGDVFHVINHRRILHFLHLFMNELPKPKYMLTPIGDLGLGTMVDVATVSEDSPVIDALKLLDKHKVSGLPVVDSQGRVTDIFTKTDVLVLAGEKLFYDLSIQVKSVISLHSLAEPEDGGPSLTRMMPGSPALARRRFPSGQDHSHALSSAKAHPFLRDSDNAPRLMTSPLVTTSVSSNKSTHSDTKKTRDKNHHHAATPPIIRTPGGKENMAKGDPGIVSPTNQVFLHRRRHLSSNLSKSTSISSHLVTVTKMDTFESVVSSIVNADVLQAVIVNHCDQVQGVISIGDILRYMVYPTDKDGKVIKPTVTDKPPLGDKTSTRLTGNDQKDSRVRTASDDTDLTSSLVRKQSQDLTANSGSIGPVSSTPPGRTTTSHASNSSQRRATAANSPAAEPLLKKKHSNTKSPFARRLKSGEKIDRL